MDLFVPPGFSGAGVGGAFLDALIQQLSDGVEVTRAEKTEKWIVNVIRVSLITPKDKGDFSPFKRTDIGHRQERTDTVNFYKSRGFRYQSPDNGGATELVWERRLSEK